MSDNTAPLTCLLIEDDEDDYLLSEECLSDIPSREVEVKWAASYEEAASALSDPKIDVCLVDYRIGVRTGVDFIREMRAEGVRTPMILLTGLGTEEVDQEALDAGAADFLEKGEISPRLLERTIRYAMAQAEQLNALEARTSLLRATLEHTGTGIAAFNERRELETCNQRILNFLEIDVDDADADAVAVDAEGDGGAAIAAADNSKIGELILERIGESFEWAAADPVEIQTSDGRYIEVRHNVSPGSDRHVVVCFDVTERKRNEVELIQSRESALEASKAKSEFIANMSHELRTPLHAIIGFSNLLVTESSGPLNAPEYTEYVNDIHNSGKHLLAMINDILDLSRIEVRRYELRERAFDPRKVVQNAWSQVQEQATSKGVAFGMAAPDDLAPVFADSRAVGQIFVNLFSNAVKFTESGGRVDVSFEQSPERGAVISVQDTGIGMSPEYVQKCFDPFTQEQGDLSRAQDGTGLGLALVRKLAELHGGAVEATSELGVGTCVKLVLPPERVRWPDAGDAASSAA